MPHPGPTLTLHFPVNKLQMPYLVYRKSVIIWSKRVKHATEIAPSRPVIIIAKMVYPIWWISMTELYTTILITPFLFSKVFKLVNYNQITDKLINMIIFSSPWNRLVNVVALIRQNTKLISAFKHLAEFFSDSLPQPFAHSESVFSFKQCIDCFSSMYEPIKLAGSREALP